jgi:hypothetical protein
MKKILVLVSLLVLAAACATQPSGNSNLTANTSNANKGTEVKSTAGPSESDIIAKEKAAWDAYKRKDADAFKKAVTAEYIEVHDNGVKDTAAILVDMKDTDMTDVTFADWKMTKIDKDLVIITYSATVKGTYKGEAVPPGPYRDAAAYVNRNGEWLGAYFQETLSTPPTPPPSPSQSPAKKPAASPAATIAKPVEAGADPIANEKIVWDLFKTKNFDAFAALLAPEFVEIESTGAYDKAGSVKGLRESMDATQFEFSDWKSVKLDNDASLVTYTVTAKGAKPMKDYHATIWANRDGKWLAFYHQGTPAAAPAAAKPESKKM